MLRRLKFAVRSSRLFGWLKKQEAKSPSSFWILVVMGVAVILGFAGIAFNHCGFPIIGFVFSLAALGCILITVPLNGG